MQELPHCGIRRMIVVLAERDEAPRRSSERRRPTSLVLPAIALALVEEAVLGAGDQLLRRPEVVRVVGLVPSGQCHTRGVVEVVVPERVQPLTTFPDRLNEADVLGLVLRHHERPALTRRTA